MLLKNVDVCLTLLSHCNTRILCQLAIFPQLGITTYSGSGRIACTPTRRIDRHRQPTYSAPAIGETIMALFSLHRPKPPDWWCCVNTNPTLVPTLLEQTVEHLQQPPSQWTLPQCEPVKIALREALHNAIKHGNQLDPRKNITVTVTCTTRSITVKVTDQGEGFTPPHVFCVPDPLLSGRGLEIIITLASHYEFKDDGRTIEFTIQRPE